MKLTIMRITQLALVLFFSFQLNAQIPDSLGVELPWDIVYVSSCDDTMGEGPKTNNEEVYIFLDSDKIISNDVDECTVRIKEWRVFDLLTGNLYEFQQLAKIDEVANTKCETDLYIHYDDFPLELSPNDLLLDLDPSHDYSFSYSNAAEESLTVNGNSDNNFEMYVYNFTNNTVCKTNVYLTKCEEDINLLFPETTEVIFNQEPYIEVTLDMLGVVIDYPCSTYNTKIRLGNSSSNILFSQSVGKLVVAKVEITFNDGSRYKKNINVNVRGEKPAPLSMYIEEKTFVAGETVSLEVWSEGQLGLIAWQLQLLFKDAEIIAVEESALFTDIPFNILEDNTVIRTLWTPADASSINVASNITWFTLVVKPSVDGSTLDIFETGQDPWSLIGIEDDNYIFEYEAEFVFNVAPRNILSASDDINFESVDVYPNPSSNILEIIGLSNTKSITKIEIVDLAGKLMTSENIDNPKSKMTVDISDLPTGIYVLKAQNGNTITSHKITKI